MKKKLLALLALLGVVVGLTVAVPTVEAGVYSSLTTSNHTAPKWICFDISAGSGIIQTSPSSQMGFVMTYVSNTPSRGYINYDSECNAGAGNVTTMTGPGTNSYGLPPSGWTITDDNVGPPFPGKIIVSANARDYIAWWANTQSGFLCMVVP